MVLNEESKMQGQKHYSLKVMVCCMDDKGHHGFFPLSPVIYSETNLLAFSA